MTTRRRPFAPTLASLAPALAWAHAFEAAYRAHPRRLSAYEGARRAEFWLAQELLRLELAAIAAEAPGDGGDLLARTLEALESLGQAEYDFRNDGSHLGEALSLWCDRAPGACAEVVSRLAEHPWGNVRYYVARSASPDTPAGVSALTRLCRDGDSVVKKTALERLRASRDVSFWQTAFSADPFAGLHPRAQKRLQKPVAVVCEAFTPGEAGRRGDDPRPGATERYAEALAALPDRLVIDHARTVLPGSGYRSPFAAVTLQALGARPDSMDTVLAMVPRWEHELSHRPGIALYFQAVATTSPSNRVRCVLRLTRWAHDAEQDADSALSMWSLLNEASLKSLWPPKRSPRPWITLLLELGEHAPSTAVQEGFSAIGASRIPPDLRAKLLEHWVAQVDEGDDGPLTGYDPTALAASLPPRSRRALVEEILRVRRSAEAMGWALEQITGPLHVARRDGSLEALRARLYADPGLRAVVLSSRRLARSFFDRVREDLGARRITRASELTNALDVASVLAGNGHWFEMYLSEAKTRARSRGAEDPTVAPLTEDEWEVVRDLRPAALAEGTEPPRWLLELFPKESWNERDRADFMDLAARSVEGFAEDDEDDDLDLVAYALDRQWHPSFVPAAGSLAEALVGHSGLRSAEMRQRLLARLEAADPPPSSA